MIFVMWHKPLNLNAKSKHETLKTLSSKVSSRATSQGKDKLMAYLQTLAQQSNQRPLAQQAIIMLQPLRWCCIESNVWFTMNGMCMKNNNIYTWHEQAIIEFTCHGHSIVACCHSAKLCAHVAWAFRTQQNGAVTRMWRLCYVRPSQKNVRSMPVVVKRRDVVATSLCWRCVECVIHYKWDVHEEKHHIYVAQTSNNRVIAVHDLYCCLLSQCEALRTCRSGFSDRNSRH